METSSKNKELLKEKPTKEMKKRFYERETRIKVGTLKRLRIQFIDLNKRVTNLEDNTERIRVDMFQTISIYVGLLGIIFAIIIAAAFEPDIIINSGNFLSSLILLILILISIWFGLWLIKNFGKKGSINGRIQKRDNRNI